MKKLVECSGAPLPPPILQPVPCGFRRSENKDIIAMGPISACTNLLADAGRRVEILEFHQYEIFEATVIFIRTCDHDKQAWAMGFGATTELAAASALSAAAERLHG